MTGHYEQLLAYISTHMPRPFTQDESDGAVVFTGGSPGEVIVRLTATTVIVEEYAVSWETTARPVLRPRRVGSVKWRRLPESELMTIVRQLIKGARQIRLARFRSCRRCGKVQPPEFIAAGELCRMCVDRSPAVIH